MMLPTRFDANEWVVTGSAILLIFLFIRLPRRFPPQVTVAVLLFMSFFGRSVDHIVFSDYPFDLYDTFDTKKFDLFDFILYLFVYTFYGYFFVYVYDMRKGRGWRRILHILVWSGVSMGLEYLGVLFHVYIYKGWKLIFSLPVYLAVFGLMMLFFELVNGRGGRQKI